MCDYFDDFEDDFDNDDFMDENWLEDEYNSDTEIDEPYAGDNEPEDETDEAESKDDFTARDAFIMGGAMGFAYEQGLRERKRRKRERFGDDSD
jgi:hypothetical protein